MLTKIFKSKLTFKIFMVTGSLLILSSMITLGLIAVFMPQNYEYQINERMGQSTDRLLNDLSKLTLEEAKVTLEKYSFDNGAFVVLSSFSQYGTQDIVFATITDTEDTLSIAVEGDSTVYSTRGYLSGSIWEDDKPIGDAVLAEIANESDIVTTEAFGITFADSDIEYLLEIGVSLQEVDRSVEALKNVIPYVLFAVILISILGALFYSYFITKPILQLNETSKKLSKLDFHVDCINHRKDELGELSQSMNEMATQLDSTLTKLKTANTKLEQDIDLERKLKEKQLSFFSAVSHELKTPITIIRGQLEGMIHCVGRYQDRDKYLNRSLEVTTSMQELVQEILMSSKLGFSNVNLNLEEVSLEEMVEEILSNYEELTLSKQIKLIKYYTQNLSINADRQMFSKVISNLITNALRYSPDKASIIIEFNKVENTPNLTIENTGIFIPEDDLEKLCEPFYRVETSRNKESGGSGLGLHLANSIVSLHGFSLTLENTEKGVKATVICQNTNSIATP